MRLARMWTTIGTLGLVAVLALPAGAAPSVAITSAVRSGTSASVSGTVSFPPSADPVSVGGVNTNFGPAQAAPVAGPASENAGFDLVDARIAPLADGSGLRFIWQLKSLPDQVPPEGVRYAWGLSIAGKPYQLQAKRTNMSSITTVEDPVNHVQQLASQKGFFQLRGACVAAYEGAPVNGCYHLAFLNGGFDTAKDQVFIDWPYSTKDEIGRVVAPDFKPGVVLEPFESAALSISAGLQGVVTNTTLSDFINGWTPYYAGKVVQVGVGAETAKPESVNYSTAAALSGDAFAATVNGLSDKAPAVFVRACSALECSYASATPAAG